MSWAFELVVRTHCARLERSEMSPRPRNLIERDVARNILRCYNTNSKTVKLGISLLRKVVRRSHLTLYIKLIAGVYGQVSASETVTTVFGVTTKSALSDEKRVPGQEAAVLTDDGPHQQS